MIKVSKKEFYRRLFELSINVNPDPKGSYPYTTEFKTPSGRVWGKTVPVDGVGRRDYYIMEAV